MSKIAVVYWSGTGNTEIMANLVKEGAEQSGAEVNLHTTGDFSADKVDTYDAIAFGCPSMGDEVLEEEEFEPLFQECKGKLKNKPIALFGSYGWGSGEWMQNWEETCREEGAKIVGDSVICCGSPDEDDQKEACKALGKALAGNA